MNTENLNQIEVRTHEESNYERLSMIVGSDRKSWAYFDNLEQHLIANICDADVILGCVAWLTNDAILDALAKKRAVSIVVQKEDFLRPDIVYKSNWSNHLRSKYAILKGGLEPRELPESLFHHLNYAGAWTLDPVRCVGNLNSDKAPAFPRSHHKFVLFCHLREKRETWEVPRHVYVPDLDDWREDGIDVQTITIRTIEPYAVWTGSFNFTKNATYSFENAVVLTDHNIVNAYLREFAHVYALSESLDWFAKWVEPEYRIGT